MGAGAGINGGAALDRVDGGASLDGRFPIYPICPIRPISPIFPIFPILPIAPVVFSPYLTLHSYSLPKRSVVLITTLLSGVVRLQRK